MGNWLEVSELELMFEYLCLLEDEEEPAGPHRTWFPKPQAKESVLEFIQRAQRERARRAIYIRIFCTNKIRTIHKLINLIPQSIHPIASID